jgi:hypothetical protein
MPAVAQDLAREHTVKGTNLDGSSCAGTAEIVITPNSTCKFNQASLGRGTVCICTPDGYSLAALYVI